MNKNVCMGMVCGCGVTMEDVVAEIGIDLPGFHAKTNETGGTESSNGEARFFGEIFGIVSV